MVGAESFNATGLFAPAMHGQLVVKHIRALRKNLPGLSGADIIFVPESNSEFASQSYCLAIISEQIPRVYLMDEDKKHVGMRSTNSSKICMANLMRNLLQAKMVKFHPFFVSSSEEPGAEALKKLIVQQLGDYKRQVKTRHSHNDDGVSNYTEIYSGKHGGRHDDHAVGMQLNYLGYVIYTQKYESVYKGKPPLWQPA